MTETVEPIWTWEYFLRYEVPSDRTNASVIGGGDTLSAVVSDVFKQATYYRGLGYKVWVSIRMVCRKCQGEGWIIKGNVPNRIRLLGFIPEKHRKACPQCLGVKQPYVVDKAPLIESHHVQIAIP